MAPAEHPSPHTRRQNGSADGLPLHSVVSCRSVQPRGSGLRRTGDPAITAVAIFQAPQAPFRAPRPAAARSNWSAGPA